MAANTRYRCLPGDARRPSVDSINDGSDLLSPTSHHDNDTKSPNRKEWKYFFHPTLYFRFMAAVFFLTTALQFILSHRRNSVAAALFNFVALGRELWVLLNHLLTRFIRVQVRIEFRKSGSSILEAPKRKVPGWVLLGAVQIAVDLILVPFIIGLTAAVPHHYSSWYGETLSAKILTFIALGLHILSIVDLGQPTKLTCSGKFSFDKGEDGKIAGPPLPQYHDVEATGSAEAGGKGTETGHDSPEII